MSASSGSLLPPALGPGDWIGVAAPSGVVDPEKLAAGVAELQRLGFRVRVDAGVLERDLFSAGSASRRAAALHDLFADPEVRGVVCARGGAGAMQLLDHLEPDIFRCNPKVFVGYSDATLLHGFLNRLGLVTFHGPMAAVELASGGYDAASLMRAVSGGGAPWGLGTDSVRALQAGEARGRLRGGCLSLLAAVVGTGWEAGPPGAEGTLLLLEDADEPPYKVHRMLTQLRHSGALDGVAGVVFGEMRGCAPGADAAYTLDEVLRDALDGFRGPVVLGLPCGHSATPMLTLPLGATARLSAGDEVRLEVEEAWLA